MDMDLDNMTREELINQVKSYQKLVDNILKGIEEMTIRQAAQEEESDEESDEDFNPFIPEISVGEPVIDGEVIGSTPPERYTCECGAEITFRARRRHEASARHIRMVARIRE